MAAYSASAGVKSSERFGLMMALCGAFLYSTKPIIIKWLYALGMDAVPLLMLRMAIAMPVYIFIGWLAWQRQARKPSAKQILEAMGVGILGYYFASYFDLLGLQYVGAQLERLILYAYPSFVVILGFLFFRQAMTRHHLLAMGLTYVGLSVVYGHDIQLPTSEAAELQKGTVLVLVSAIFFASYILLSRRVIDWMGSLLFTSLSMGAASVLILVHFSVDTRAQLPAMTPTLWFGAVALAIFATVVPSFLVSEAIKRIGPARTSLSGSLGPVMTTILAVVWLGEPFGWLSALGIGLVIAGVYTLQRAHR